MNLLKSVFISFFISWLVILSLYAFTQLARGAEPSLSWLGLALAAFSPLVFFIKAFVFKSARTPRHPIEYSVLSGLGLAVTMVMSFRYGQTAGSIHVWAGLTLLGWLVYLRWYSVFRGRNARALQIGSQLPVFALETLDGHRVSSETFRSGRHLLLFYRGNWCPFCIAQIEELATHYQQLASKGINVILISPQPGKKNQQLAERFAIPMTFLRDPHNTAARQLGLLHQWGTPMGLQLLGYDSDTVMPTVIMTDTSGLIVMCDQTDNYRLRPEPGVYTSVTEK